MLNLNADPDNVNVDSMGEENHNDGEQDDSLLSIYDPRTWNHLDNRKRDILIEKGPMRELGLEFPEDRVGRSFSYDYYSRKLANREIVDRK